MSGRNRLAGEPSPYLRQHARDPVDWYPWGEAAFVAARAADRPMLLSIGYSSCHWCHVMARESFRDPAVAELMNHEFVNVKVDREERPDVDAVYMAAVQAMTGSGGWPLTVITTPDGEPFYGGTYFPPDDRPGMPSFRRVLTSLAAAWRDRRADVLGAAADLGTALRRLEDPGFAPGEAGGAEAARAATARLVTMEDTENGGFGGAPKFPLHEPLRLLLEARDVAERAVALRALDAMAAGGIFDQLGGGFFRYAVDAGWRVPHFEKMLYDNAAFVRAYANAFRLTGEERYRRVALATVAWLERDLTAEDGAFYSALDAESEGEEGKYYVWTRTELEAVLGGEVARLAAQRYGIGWGGADGALQRGTTASGVPRCAASLAAVAEAAATDAARAERLLEGARELLLAHRSLRPKPATDDKVLASWNGLAVGALADASVALGERRLASVAARAADAVKERLWVDGRLWHSSCAGERRVEGLLEDYAYLGLGLISLHRATLDGRQLAWALELADAVAERFADGAGAGFFSVAEGDARLIARPKGFLDGATPSENAAGAELTWWAARYRDAAAALALSEAAVAGTAAAAAEAPQALASSARLALLQSGERREVVIVGGSRADLLGLRGALEAVVAPGLLVLAVDPRSPAELLRLPLLEGRLAALSGGPPRAYVCRAGACRLPVSTAVELGAELTSAGWPRFARAAAAP